MTDDDREKAEHLSEDILGELNLRHQTLIYTIPDIVYFKDIQGRNIVVNKAYEDFTGLKAEDIIGKKDDQILPHDLAVHCLLSDQEVINNQKSLYFEEIFESKDGKQVYFETIKSPLYDAFGNVVGVVGVSRDVTLRKHHEDQSELFSSLLNQSNDAIFIIDPKTGCFLYVNDKACISLGYSRDELTKMEVVDIEAVIPDNFSWDAHVKEVRKKGSLVIEGRHKRRDGTTIPVEINVKYITKGRDAYMVAMVRDISERIENRERYTAIIRSAMDAFWMIDRDGRFLDVNDATCAMLGYSREEMLTMRVSDVEAIEQPNEMADHIKRVIEEGYDRFETRHRRKDGSIIDAEVNVKFINISGGQFYAFVRDITERKRAEDRKIAGLIEEERMRFQRLESLGVLAGGIAHDFNNILTVVMGNISLAIQLVNSSDKLYKNLTEAEKAVVLAQDLTMQLLTFSRGGAPVKTILPIAAVVRESVEFAARGSNVRCDFAISEGLKSAEADEGQIRQVIHNLVINSLQAMPNGGTISIRCENTTIGQEGYLSLKGGDYVKVSVEDIGVGIPEEHQNRIFDPFFTTKHKGSGLGLATSYSIINKHDGLITVSSTPGKGAQFDIYLPASDRDAISEAGYDDIPVPGKGKILVMDDEDIIRRLAGDMLNYLGYQSESAADGEETIEKFKEARDSGKPYDLIIMDLTIPGAMGGKEAIERLLSIDPGVKAIVSSGYSNDPILSEYRKYGFSGIVKKPYRLAELSQIVYAVLNSSGNSVNQ